VPTTSRKQNFQMYNAQWQQQDGNKGQVLTHHCTPLLTPQTAVSGGFALSSRTPPVRHPWKSLEKLERVLAG
jgi:hypothetical protein